MIIKKSTRIFTFGLAALLSVTAVSCGGGTNTGADTTVSDATTAAQVETEDLSLVDELPEKNYNGREFRISSQKRGWYHGTWLVEEENGEVFHDSIYKRNQTIEDRFNIKLVETTFDTNVAVANIMRAGDDQFDIVHLNCGEAFSYAQEGLLRHVDDLTYVNLDKAYWDKGLNDALTFGGSRFFAVGALDLTGYDYTYAMIFNKKMVEDYKLDDPYELVKNGKWTFNAYDKMVKTVTSDVDGNTVYDDKDIYGLRAGDKQVLPYFWVGAGVNSVNINEDNYPVFNMDSDVKFIDVIEEIFKITYDNNFANRVLDLGDTIWCADVRDGVFAGMFINNDRALTSKIASMKTVVNQKIDAAIAAFEKLN